MTIGKVKIYSKQEVFNLSKNFVFIILYALKDQNIYEENLYVKIKKKNYAFSSPQFVTPKRQVLSSKPYFIIA
jgi:hypothetical protein